MKSSKQLLKRCLTPLIALSLCGVLSPVTASAQDDDEDLVTGDDGVGRFKNVTVKRITPDGLPKRSLIANSYRQINTPNRLPKPPSKKELNTVQQKLHGVTHEVIALVTPPQPYRQVPMVYRGHAVWVSAHKDQRAPVLISTLDWLSKAQEIYLVPRGKAPSVGKVTAAKRTKYVSLTSVSSRSMSKDLARIQEQKKNYIRLKRAHGDISRNLVTLKGVPTQKAPKKGLAFFNPKTTPLGYAYGYSPINQMGMVATTVMSTPPKDESLQFFVQTTFAAILGAPVASDKGELVALNALRHPKNAAITLAVPVGALIDYVRARQKIKLPKKNKL